MTTKCANPKCDHPFRYFRSGKIYLIDMANAGGLVRSSSGSREIEYFWLCGDCSQHLRVTLDECGAVKVESLTAPEPNRVVKIPVAASVKKVSATNAVARGAYGVPHDTGQACRRKPRSASGAVTDP